MSAVSPNLNTPLSFRIAVLELMVGIPYTVIPVRFPVNGKFFLNFVFKCIFVKEFFAFGALGTHLL